MVGSVAVVAIIAFVFAIFLFFSAQRATKNAEKAKIESERLFVLANKEKRKAKKALKEMKKTQINKLLTAAKNQIMLNQYFAAKPYLDSAKIISPHNTEIDSLIVVCEGH